MATQTQAHSSITDLVGSRGLTDGSSNSNNNSFFIEAELANAPPALEAAAKLERSYKETYSRIAEVREALELELQLSQQKQQQQSNNNNNNNSSNRHNQQKHGNDNEDDADDEQQKDSYSGDEQQQQQQQHHHQHHHHHRHSSGEDVFQRLINYGIGLKVKQEHARLSTLEQETSSFTPEITKTAQSLRRAGSVEDILIKKKDEYRAHIEEMRREKEMNELSSLKAPHINKVSKTMQRSEKAYNRLYESRKQTLAKREMMKNTLKSLEMAAFSGQPEINPVSRKMERGVEHILAWEEEKKRKAELLKKKVIQQELSECKKPKINPVSERLAKQMNRGIRVEDHLIQLYEQAKQKREEQKRLEKEQEKVDAVPLISLHSATLQREGPISERLYRVSFDMEMKKRELKSKLEEEQRSKRDPQTGQRLYSPFINPRSAALVRNQPVEDILTQRGEELEEKRKMMREQAELMQEQQAATATRMIGAYSKLLAELKEKREQMSAGERISQPIRHLKEKALERIRKEADGELTFHPHINENSRQLDLQVNGIAASGGPANRSAILFKKAEEYVRHREKLVEQFLAEKLAECTFSPRASRSTSTSPSAAASRPTTPRSSNHQDASGDNLRRSIGSGVDISERNKEWVQKLQQRLEAERALAEQKRLEECTFQPNVERRRQQQQQRREEAAAASTGEQQQQQQRSSSSLSNRSYTPPPQRRSDSFSMSTASSRSSSPTPSHHQHQHHNHHLLSNGGRSSSLTPPPKRPSQQQQQQQQQQHGQVLRSSTSSPLRRTSPTSSNSSSAASSSTSSKNNNNSTTTTTTTTTNSTSSISSTTTRLSSSFSNLTLNLNNNNNNINSSSSTNGNGSWPISASSNRQQKQQPQRSQSPSPNNNKNGGSCGRQSPVPSSSRPSSRQSETSAIYSQRSYGHNNNKKHTEEEEEQEEEEEDYAEGDQEEEEANTRLQIEKRQRDEERRNALNETLGVMTTLTPETEALLRDLIINSSSSSNNNNS